MKQYINCLIILLFIIILSTNSSSISSSNNTITGKAITGKATVQYASISVQITSLLPNTTLISPRNVTYFTKDNILLNYTSVNEMAFWYALDGGTNITITAPTLFNISSNGAHSLRIYANDTDNNVVVKNINFTVDNTRFNVTYSEFEGENDDETTDFDDYGYEEIQNLTNITIEKDNIGEINFLETINLTECSNNLCDLSSHINISFNRIELNSSALPNFNKSAILTLYNLTFSNPRIIKDGSLCSSSECAKITYSSGTLTFNVTSFSTYSAEETSSSSGSGDSGGSSSSSSSSGSSSEGSGAGGIAQNPPFTVQPDNLAVNLKKGELTKYNLTIINSNRSDIAIELSSNLENILVIDEKSFNLTKGQSKEINLNFIAGEKLSEGNYIGNILIKSRIADISVPISITISSVKSLFDVKISINNSQLTASPGEDLISSLKLYNLGEKETQVKATYYLKDQYNKIILTENETLYVNKELSLEKVFKLPDNVRPGQHILYVAIEYDKEIASSSVWFTVKNQKEITLERLKIPLLTVISLIIIGLILIRILKKK